MLEAGANGETVLQRTSDNFLRKINFNYCSSVTYNAIKETRDVH